MNPHALSQRQSSVAPFLLLAIFLAVCAGVGVVAGAGQSDQKGERQIEEKIPKHLPIKVKLKKPEKVKDSKNEAWADEFDLDVTNTGTKPIYYVDFALSLPDVITDNGKNVGFQIRYGRIRLVDLTEPVQPEDVPILPGETVTLQIPVDHRAGWKSLRGKGALSNPKKLLLRFQLLNHGDGTGFMTPEGIPLPNPKKVGATCRESDGRDAVARNIFGSPPGRFPDIASSSAFLPLPVSLLPAIFFSGASPAGAAANPDICCPGMGPNCEHLKPEGITCICGEVMGIQSAACSDPFGALLQELTLSYNPPSSSTSTLRESYS